MNHHDTAAALAAAGFVVASVQHPGDNHQDKSSQGSLSVFSTRPQDLRRLTDYMLDVWPLRGSIDKSKVGVFGFSRGGYTGLVAIGGRPELRVLDETCGMPEARPLCAEIRRNEIPVVPGPDVRVRAAVIMDPLNVFSSLGLQEISVPIQLWASALGGDGITLKSVKTLRHDLPKSPEWRIVENAGHFAFLAPCNKAMVESAPSICLDSEKFDRSKFHTNFNSEVVTFFRRILGPKATP